MRNDSKTDAKRREEDLNIICDKTLLSAAIDGVSKAVTLRSTIQYWRAFY